MRIQIKDCYKYDGRQTTCNPFYLKPKRAIHPFKKIKLGSRAWAFLSRLSLRAHPSSS